MASRGPTMVGARAAVAGAAKEEEDALTVQEALAFIDAFDQAGGQVPSSPGPSPVSSPGTSPVSSPGTSPVSGAGMSPESGAVWSPGSGTSSSNETDSDRKKRNAQAVRRCQRRKKQEMNELRAQVQALEEHLRQLQRVRRQQRVGFLDTAMGEEGGGAQAHTPTAVWSQLALREQVERRRSEALNLQLRAAVAKYRDMSDALQSTMRRGSAEMPQLDSMLRDEPPALPLYSSPGKAFSMDYVLADLELAMKKIYIDADTVLRSIQFVSARGRDDFRVALKQLPDGSDYVEISQAMELRAPLKAVAAAFWTGMCGDDAENEVYTIKMREKRDKDAHKSYEMVVNDPVRLHRFTLDGVSYVKKFEGTDRHLFGLTSLVTIPGMTGMFFREKSWMHLSRSPNDPSGRSVARLCYHLYPEAPALAKPPGLDSPEESELRRILSILLQAIPGKIRCESAKINDAMSRYEHGPVL